MAEDILYKFKKFAKRSREAYSDMYERIRSDRSFMSGDGQWTKEDDGFIEKTRNRVTVNVLANQVHSVANKYSSFPFTWYTGNADIDKEIDDFFAEDSNRFATEEALLDCVSFGLGVLCLGTDTTADGRDVPVIYAITDPERVMLDPDSTELDGSDAMEGALIDYRSKEWIRVHMGEQYVPEKRAKPVFAGAFAKPGLIPIVTYYYLDTDGCHVATFVNDIQVEDEKPEEEIQLEEGTIEGDGMESAGEISGNEESPDVLPIKRIPIFPVLGERTWTESDNIIYRGLIAKGKTVQRIVNYSMTQLIERLQLSPKPQFRGYLESFKNLDKYYKKAGTGINPILPGQRLANDGKTQLPLPEVYNPNIQFADLQQITNGTMEMLTSITGVDSKGLANNESEITATAVLYTSQVFQNNIKHFFSHLRTSFKALGDTVMVLLGHAGQKIDVAQGPEAYMQLQIARQELTSLVGIVEANQKPAIVNAILKTHPDNEILAQLFAELNAAPQPTEMEAQQAEVIEQMKQAIEQKDQEIINLTAQVEDYARSERSQDKSILADMAKSEQQHEFKLEEMAVQAELEAGADAVKIAADADKAQMDVESKAVALETQKIKSASEIFKTLGTGV
jgi:hypothetical protein